MYPPSESQSENMTVGRSMLPAIFPGARLSVKPIGRGEAVIGDVLCYPGDSMKMVAHRVVDLEEKNGDRFYITRGDSQIETESVPVAAAAFKVTEVIYSRFSYRTDGIFGRLFASVALSEKPGWQRIRPSIIHGSLRSAHLVRGFARLANNLVMHLGAGSRNL